MSLDDQDFRKLVEGDTFRDAYERDAERARIEARRLRMAVRARTIGGGR